MHINIVLKNMMKKNNTLVRMVRSRFTHFLVYNLSMPVIDEEAHKTVMLITQRTHIIYYIWRCVNVCVYMECVMNSHDDYQIPNHGLLFICSFSVVADASGRFIR